MGPARCVSDPHVPPAPSGLENSRGLRTTYRGEHPITWGGATEAEKLDNSPHLTRGVRWESRPPASGTALPGVVAAGHRGLFHFRLTLINKRDNSVLQLHEPPRKH